MGDAVNAPGREKVVIVGGGPVGLFLACELRLAGLDPLVCERTERGQIESDPSAPTADGVRGISARSIATLELRGLGSRVRECSEAAVAKMRLMGAALRKAGEGLDSAGAETMAQFTKLLNALGTESAKGHFAAIPLMDEAGHVTDVHGPTTVMNTTFVDILSARAEELGVRVLHSAEVVKLEAASDRVCVWLADGRQLEAEYLVGCDGGRSMVRAAVGIEMAGTEPAMVHRSGVAELDRPELIPLGITPMPTGLLQVMPPPGTITVFEFADLSIPDRTATVSREEFEASLRRVSETDVRVVTLSRAQRFTDNARQAVRYRAGRVLLAGDSAHVHAPVGGQGLNLGLQDAANLGWKLALVLRGHKPDAFLDTYQDERGPAAARVLRNARAQTALLRTDAQALALREVFSELAAYPDVVRHIAKMMGGLHLRLTAPPDAHPATGGFAPNVSVDGVDGKATLYESMADARPVLLLDSSAARGWTEVGSRWPGLHLVRACEPLPHEATALLIRPDGYIAWAAGADGDCSRLGEVVRTAFG